LSGASGSQRAPKGLFVGLTTVDVIFGFDRYPDEDTKSTAQRFTLSAGGPATNAAVVFPYLGGEAQLISALGKSAISEIAAADLARCRVQHLDIAANLERQPALSAIAIAGHRATRTVFTSPAINDQFENALSGEQTAGFVREADIVLLDGHQAKLAIGIAQLAKKNEIPVVLDGDLYTPNNEDLLPVVDIVIFGKSFTIPGMRSKDDVFKYLESFGIKSLIETNGSKAVEFISGGVSGSVPVEKVREADTLAAGDFFHGAFCYSYCVLRDLQRAIMFAARVASQSVTRFGTRDWMDERESSSFE
jgi:sugar/nucleoside kinase (ribokinase family)